MDALQQRIFAKKIAQKIATFQKDLHTRYAVHLRRSGAMVESADILRDFVILELAQVRTEIFELKEILKRNTTN